MNFKMFHSVRSDCIPKNTFCKKEDWIVRRKLQVIQMSIMTFSVFVSFAGQILWETFEISNLHEKRHEDQKTQEQLFSSRNQFLSITAKKLNQKLYFLEYIYLTARLKYF